MRNDQIVTKVPSVLLCWSLGSTTPGMFDGQKPMFAPMDGNNVRKQGGAAHYDAPPKRSHFTKDSDNDDVQNGFVYASMILIT